jgi:hypothetical protein
LSETAGENQRRAGAESVVSYIEAEAQPGGQVRTPARGSMRWRQGDCLGELRAEGTGFGRRRDLCGGVDA